MHRANAWRIHFLYTLDEAPRSSGKPLGGLPRSLWQIYGILKMDAFQILVVDDESALREICQEALTDDGYNVDVAGNGREALGKLIGKEYDLVISDLRMPDMNGQDLLTAIRQRNLDVDFLVMTGFGTTETAVEFMRDGAVDYISKPFDIKQMLLRVHAVLDRRVIRRTQEKLSAVVRMLNLSKGLASQLDHIAVVDEFLCHLEREFQAGQHLPSSARSSGPESEHRPGKSAAPQRETELLCDKVVPGGHGEWAFSSARQIHDARFLLRSVPFSRGLPLFGHGPAS